MENMHYKIKYKPLKELYTQSIYDNGKILSICISDDSICIYFEDGTNINIADHHNDDCYESVYADFSIMQYYNNIIGNIYTTFSIYGIKGMGFVMKFGEYDKILIPCYNIQNGYYSSNLTLSINGTEIDISNLVEDHIY